MKRLLAALVCAMLVSGCSLARYYTSKKEDEEKYPLYVEAFRMLQNGQFDEAAEIFDGMRTYLDSEDLYYEAVYQRLLDEADHYYESAEGFEAVERDYLILSYDGRNEKMLEQQGLYLELLIIASKIYLGQQIDCDQDFYYYEAKSFWDMFESATVLNSEKLIETLREFKSANPKSCVVEEN